MRAMEEWKKKQAEKEKEGSAKDDIIERMRLDKARLQKDLEESGNSSSLSVPKAAESKAVEESYTTDDFDDVSVSGSGSKKFELASRAPAQASTTSTAFAKSKAKIDDSLKSSTSGLSASNSKSIGDLKSNSRLGESSDVYDDDEFESMSKSHKDMQKALPVVQKLETLKSINSNASNTVV